MVGKKTHPNPERDKMRKQFLKGQTVASYTLRGSSLKFCLIADGTAHLYPRFVPTYEWDTAAAHALLLQTGGDIVDFETRQRLQYGKPNFLNGHLVTGTNEVLKILNP
jgi:3'(2'), 5'-bisphosphate nucleotidase